MRLPPWKNAHDEAQRAGEPRYVDPATGYQVFTEATLRARGRCCGSGCRHCPYGHVRLRRAPATRREGEPTWRRVADEAPPEVDVLFWSGGKDAWLAWLALREEAARPTVLLTTHEPDRDWVAHQETPLSTVIEQAHALDAELVTLPTATDYTDDVRRTLDIVHTRSTVRRLVWGDLHLDSIRTWREEAFGPWAEAVSASLHFPLWRRDYGELTRRLHAAGQPIVISAATPDTGLSPGDLFDPAAVSDQVDPMGENGEFHTWVQLRRPA